MWIDDQILKCCREQIFLHCFSPDQTLVVVGNGNDKHLECFIEKCQQDDIPILRRYGGGGAVTLHPGCLVVSLGAWVKRPFDNGFYFRAINQALIDILGMYDPLFSKMVTAGISDIAFFDRKVAGTSLFRSRNYLLYQASILVEARTEVMSLYLRHPSKEPSYRQKKDHEAFVIGLSEILERPVAFQQLEDLFKVYFLDRLHHHLADELIDPIDEHMPALFKRALNDRKHEQL